MDPDSQWDAVVFYNQLDVVDVREIVARLEKKRIRVWFAPNLAGGTEWEESAREALRVAPCAVAFIGAVAGFWQQREIRAALRQTRVIPVPLPGIKTLPREWGIDLGSQTPVPFDGVDDEKALASLVRSIHVAIRLAHRRTYEIEIDVPQVAQTCVLVASPAAMDALRAEVERAIREVQAARQRTVQTCVALGPPPAATSSVQEIRASELLIADCTSVGSPSAIPADVAYRIGMAHALGKPTILIAEDEERVRAQLPFPSEGEARQVLPTIQVLRRSAAGGLERPLVASIAAACAAVVPDLLVDQRVAGIRVVGPDQRCLRPRLWPDFHRLLSFDLETIDSCQTLLRESHALLEHIRAIAHLIREERGAARSEIELEARRKKMLGRHHRFDEQRKNWEERFHPRLQEFKGDIDDTFPRIRAHLTEEALVALTDAQTRWGLVQDDVQEFCGHCAELAMYAESGFACLDNHRQPQDLLHRMESVHQSLCDVHEDAHKMMTKLLLVVLGGMSHAGSEPGRGRAEVA